MKSLPGASGHCGVSHNLSCFVDSRVLVTLRAASYYALPGGACPVVTLSLDSPGIQVTGINRGRNFAETSMSMTASWLRGYADHVARRATASRTGPSPGVLPLLLLPLLCERVQVAVFRMGSAIGGIDAVPLHEAEPA